MKRTNIIKLFIKEEFDLEIQIKDIDSTWEIGQKLSVMLYPQYLKDNDIEYFISTLKDNDLDINHQLIWLDGTSPLERSLWAPELEVATKLVENGAIIDPNLLAYATFTNDLNTLDWDLSHTQADNINYRNKKGYTALDYATDPKIIKTLISAGAKIYPPDYEKTCSVNPNYKEPQELSPILIKQLEALECFLGPLYKVSSYTETYEDCEFIVRLPQIIAAGLYEGKIIDILEPMMEYWQEVISPAAQEYIEKHGNSDICLPLINEYSMFLDHI